MLLIVNNGSHFLSELETVLAGLGASHRSLAATARISPASLVGFDGVILTGGDVLLSRYPDHTKMRLDLTVLDAADVPVLGICLGHQLVAWHRGARIEQLPHSIDRMETIELLADDPLLAHLPKRVAMRLAHDEQVVDLPAPLVHLARSGVGAYEAVRDGDRSVYGVQFHPEASGDAGRILLGNFLDICTEDP